MVWLPDGEKFLKITHFAHFERIHERDGNGQTDGPTDTTRRRHRPCLCGGLSCDTIK